MTQKLFVGGIAFTTTEAGVRTFFSQCGTVVTASLITDQMTGRPKGFGFVEMQTVDEAQAAVSRLHGRELDGRALTVQIAKPKTADRDRGARTSRP
ncbi:MAG: RNA recognition motif domain-containing protein [Candidatus Rokuibacteriota bacterium]